MIDGIADASRVVQSSAGMQGFDKDTFLKLLVAQLRYQNPLSQMDGNEYMGQAAQFAGVERLEQVLQAQNEIVAYQQILLSSSMVGKEVTGIPLLGFDPITGVVDGVTFDDGVPSLLVGEKKIPLGAVQEVRQPAG